MAFDLTHPSHFAFHSIAKSNMPHHEKSSLTRFFEKHIEPESWRHAAQYKPKHGLTAHHAKTAGAVVIQSVEALGVGAGLAVLHANLKHGLDIQVKAAGPDGKGGLSLSADFFAGLIGMGAGVAMAHDEHGSDFVRNLAAPGFAVFGFRKTMDMIAEKKAASGQAMGGTVGSGKAAVHAGDFGAEDPILAAARSL